jgi:hypothetical protein
MPKGECNCGAVQFEIDADLTDVYVCHCSICRRFTGSQGIAVVVFPKEQFHWLRGQDHVTTWQKPDTDWHAFFCRICGSALPGENDPRTMFAPAGALTQGGEALVVRHHVWVGSKAPWDEIGDAGRQHPEGIRSG